ncbi:uncharacterized protein [Anabrus simplex]|uniref:uncharacterized protein n=1 Tax=Anabrus simplex TaxID=316456 RepID=UPI0035A33406
MEQFYSLLCVMGISAMSGDFNPTVDIVGKLPPEVAIQILRLLDSRSLVSAALVSKRWLQLCRMDRTLKHRVHRQLHRERCKIYELIIGSQPTVLRDCDENSAIPVPFAPRNDRFKTVKPSSQSINYTTSTASQQLVVLDQYLPPVTLANRQLDRSAGWLMAKGGQKMNTESRTKIAALRKNEQFRRRRLRL